MQTGNLIQFANSPINSHIVYRVDRIDLDNRRVDVSTVEPEFGMVAKYNPSYERFTELGPYLSVPTQEEIDALIAFYRGALADILEMVEHVQLIAQLFGEGIASMFLSFADMAALSDIVDEYGQAINDLNTFGFFPNSDDAVFDLVIVLV